MPFALALLIAGAAFFGWRIWSRRRTHKALLETTLTDHQRAIVADQVPLVRRLPSELHRALEGKINVFLNQVEFVGCNGLEVTEEMELSIAAQACLLVVNSDTWYSHLNTVLIYPGAFKSLRQEREGYVVTEKETVRLGESWSRGPVILSWADTEQSALNDRDGHNVAIHEFAHQIDDLSGHTDGAPVLSKGQSFANWEKVFVSAYDIHVDNVARGQKTFIDSYGAEGHQEFFAVTVELFFERPAALSQEEPAVYDQLAQLFALDPKNWG